MKGVNILNEHSRERERERERERTESKDWIGNQRSIYTTLGASNHSRASSAEGEKSKANRKALKLSQANQKERNTPTWQK